MKDDSIKPTNLIIVVINWFDIKFTMQNVTFSNLNFSKNANIIYFKQQTLSPFILENSYFENIIGGKILLEPDTSDITTLPATLNVYNLTVANNDFKDTIIH